MNIAQRTVLGRVDGDAAFAHDRRVGARDGRDARLAGAFESVRVERADGTETAGQRKPARAGRRAAHMTRTSSFDESAAIVREYVGAPTSERAHRAS